MKTPAVLIIALFLLSCGIQTSVNQPGQYTSLPEAEVADTNIYPMKHLVVVEDDALSGKTFIYAFSGDLSGAGVGIESLDRIFAMGDTASHFVILGLSFSANRSKVTASQSLSIRATRW